MQKFEHKATNSEEESTEEIEESKMGLMKTHPTQVTRGKNLEERTRIQASDTGKQGSWTEGVEQFQLTKKTQNKPDGEKQRQQ